MTNVADGELTELQRRWVDAFCGEALGNLAKASRIAGYTGSTQALSAIGRKNYDNPTVQAEIVKWRALNTSTAIMTRRARLERLSQIAALDLTNTKNHQAITSALDIMAKMNGDYITRVEVQVKTHIQVVLAALKGEISTEAFREVMLAMQKLPAKVLASQAAQHTLPANVVVNKEGE